MAPAIEIWFFSRQSGVGLNSMCARVGGILAPLIRLLADYHDSLPMFVYGIVPVCAVGLCLLLPETLNAELQEHVMLKWVDECYGKTKTTDTNDDFCFLFFNPVIFFLSRRIDTGYIEGDENWSKITALLFIWTITDICAVVGATAAYQQNTWFCHLLTQLSRNDVNIIYLYFVQVIILWVCYSNFVGLVGKWWRWSMLKDLKRNLEVHLCQ